jgi:arginyl-tRNA synthetase
MSAEGYFRPYADRLMKELWQRKALGEDVAYLLGQLSNEPRLDIRKFKDPDALKVFFDLMGPWLRDQVAQERVPATYLDQWQELHNHLDWWEDSPDWEQQVKETFQEWERKDPDLMALWSMTRQWSLDEFNAIYGELGVEFDIFFYESEVEDEGRVIVQELLDRGVAEISEGLPVVKIDEKLGLEKEKYRVLPILRSDGTTLYSTKDLALAKVKFEQYQIDRSLYVVDVRQSLYMQQIFKVLELWGFPQAKQCFHLGYEFVAMPEGVMSSRKGNVTLFEDVLAEALERARAIIDEKNPALAEAQKIEISRQVAIGSLLYYMLSRDRNSVIVFDWDKALSFDGQAAPYIQYAHARACRILERAETSVTPETEIVFDDLTTEELNLIQEIARFGGEVERSAAHYNPLQIVNYVYALAKTFNDFYHTCPVISAPEPRRTARLALVAATRQVLANGLGLLGIAAPEVM